MRIIVQILTNALAISLAAYFVPGISFDGDLFTLVIAGLVLGLINFFLKPVLKIISIPLIILSLGLFTVIINIGMLWMLEYFIKELTITGFWAYFWGTMVMSIVNIFVGITIKKDI